MCRSKIKERGFKEWIFYLGQNMMPKYRQHVHVLVHALVVWVDVLDVLDAPAVWGQNKEGGL